jgi:hypothetical protein
MLITSTLTSRETRMTWRNDACGDQEVIRATVVRLPSVIRAFEKRQKRPATNLEWYEEFVRRREFFADDANS